MSDRLSLKCPECAAENSAASSLDRREFIRAVSGSVAGLMGAAALSSTNRGAAADTTSGTKGKPAETLVQELYATLTDEQRQAVVYPWDHGVEKGTPTRLRTFNGPPMGKNISQQFTKPQQELINATLRSMLSGGEAYERLERHGRWDGAGSFAGNGVAIFGDPSGSSPYSWVFAGHHLTLRSDGNSQPKTAFGGPMYYGHSAPGYSDRNVYLYQTQQVKSVFDALSEQQRKQAVVVGNSPGDGAAGIKFRDESSRPGITYGALDASQRDLVANVMRTLLAPFRHEDADEAMQLLKDNGGIEKIRLAFFQDEPGSGENRWDFWRLEGPGFVWNYRVLPHVHCFVNIVGQA